MIWLKKNGHLKKSHRIGLVLSLIFCSLFFSSLSISNCWATDTFLLNSGTFIYSSNHVNGPWNISKQVGFTGQHNWNNIITTTGDPNSDYNVQIIRYQGLGGVSIATVPITHDDTNASIHLEFNQVFWNLGQNLKQYVLSNLDNVVVTAVQTSGTPIVADLLTSNVQYVTNDWTTNVQSGVASYYLTNTTVTWYVDVAIGGLVKNSSNQVIILLQLPNSSYAYSALMPSYSFASYLESGSGTISYTNDADRAIQVTQNNILNQQLQIQQWQYEQEQRDRNDLLNLSNQGEVDASNAQSSAETASSNLLNVIGNIYSNLLYPQVTSCRITGVQVYEMNLGTLDFCTGFDIPQPLFAIGSIIMISLELLLAWSVLNGAMALYKELFR